MLVMFIWTHEPSFRALMHKEAARKTAPHLRRILRGFELRLPIEKNHAPPTNKATRGSTNPAPAVQRTHGTRACRTVI